MLADVYGCPKHLKGIRLPTLAFTKQMAFKKVLEGTFNSNEDFSGSPMILLLLLSPVTKKQKFYITVNNYNTCILYDVYAGSGAGTDHIKTTKAYVSGQEMKIRL